jgi:hypothetical protein
MGAEMNAKHAREEARKAARETDRAEACASSIWMEGYGGPAQPSPIGQCIHGGLGWLEVECNRCKIRASLPLDCIRRPRDRPVWKLQASLKCRHPEGEIGATGAHHQADRNAVGHALQVGASGGREAGAPSERGEFSRSSAGNCFFVAANLILPARFRASILAGPPGIACAAASAACAVSQS